MEQDKKERLFEDNNQEDFDVKEYIADDASRLLQSMRTAESPGVTKLGFPVVHLDENSAIPSERSSSSGPQRDGPSAKDRSAPARDDDKTFADISTDNIKKIKVSVANLGNDSYVKREAASAFLASIGDKALPFLRDVANSADPEVTRRVARLVDSSYKRVVSKSSSEIAEEWSDGVAVNPDCTKLEGIDALLNSEPENTKSRAIAAGYLIDIIKMGGGNPTLRAERLDQLGKNKTDYGDLKDAKARITELAKSIKTISGSENDSNKLLKDLRHCVNLEAASFSSPLIKDDDLVNLKPLTKIEILRLEGTSVTDKGLKTVGELTSLQRLSATGASFGDDGVSFLKSLKDLRLLDLSDSKVTNKSATSFDDFKKLEHINLKNTQITDESLKTFGKMKGMDYLNLEGTKVTDAGTKELIALQDLRLLNLKSTSISDTSVESLSQLKNLRYLNLSGTNMSDKALRDLQKSLPKTRIHHERLSDRQTPVL
jgi:hypothetical protein